MLKKMTNLGGLFAQRADHPLADPRELKKIIAELPKDNAFRALDEVAGWLESLQGEHDCPLDRVFDAARQMTEAAQPHLKRLARDYLHTPRLNRSDEKRLWSINYGFWTLLAATYESCLRVAESDKGKVADALRRELPMLCTCLLEALGAVLKWEQFHYGPSPGELWKRLGHVLLVAEEAGVANKVVSLGGTAGVSHAAQEYLKVMIFQAASMDSLLPLEIDLAERLIDHFLPGFVLTSEAMPDSVYWVDLVLPQPPLRLARMPERSAPTLRFCKPGAAHAAMLDVLNLLEKGGDVPAEINLGAQYHPKTLVPVLRHLVAYLAPIPPQRKHDRHRVKHRMSVLNGLVNAFVAFSGEFGGRPAGLQMESWVVENVSRGGFGAMLNSIPAEWLKVGALIAMQPEGGENWLLGIIRRYHRQSETEAKVGIEALARLAVSAELKPRTASSYAAVAGIPALLVMDGNEAGELRVVLPPMTFDLRENLELSLNGERQLLKPVSLIESTPDYELARYRVTVLG